MALVLLSSFSLVQAVDIAGSAAAQTQATQEQREGALTPPRGEDAAAYRKTASGAGLQDDLIYLPPGTPLDAEVDEEPETPDMSDFAGETPVAMQAAAWAILAAILALLLFLAIRYRRLLVELFSGGNDRRIGTAVDSLEVEDGGTREIDHDLLARLRAEPDPRVGVRILLKRFLALAARENDIVLRRSLTTRELMRLLPGGWRHRSDLEQLASRVELTVFGGREMSRQAYQECLDLAAPLLFRVEPA
ncbi:DUF4129 domain-containing protein [Mangrovicella endophytica]|uniref:DUF4129 domain-containing protein n=1 Tax=Mangrovicella endophytica TaxID=2066697 RepID=UPI001300117D|nr:DUF4129 domain-containing protein [Mangrovicella endophytica]